MPRDRPALLLLAPLAAAAALALASCGNRERPVDVAAENKIFLVGNGTEPKTIDPQLSTGFPESQIEGCLFEGLIDFHPTDDTVPVPGVAESWEHEDFTNWTFKLRQNAKWSNGDPVTAQDFIYSYQRILSPELASEYAEMVFGFLKGARAFYDGETTDFSTVGVKAPDDHTLTIELVGPTPFFLNILKHHSWWPVHPPTIENFGGMTNRNSAWAQEGNLVGNGPFNLGEWRTNDVLKVVKSDTYWNAAQTGLNEVHFFPIDMETSEDRAYRDGQLHKTNTVPLDKIPVYRESRNDLHIDDASIVYFYRINTTRPPLDDPRVRKALALAIDRQSLIDNILRADQRAAYGFTPASDDYQPPQLVGFDLEQAKALLAEAGYPGGEGFPTFEILINTMESHRIVAEVIQEMWKQNLGIDVTIRNEEWKVYLDSQQNLDYDIARAGWVADFPDPLTFLNIWIKDGGNNETGWSNQRYEELLGQSFANSEEAHYKALFDAETILLEEMPIIPIYWYTRQYLLDPRVKNWHPKMLDQRPYQRLTIEAGPAPAQ